LQAILVRMRCTLAWFSLWDATIPGRCLLSQDGTESSYLFHQGLDDTASGVLHIQKLESGLVIPAAPGGLAPDGPGVKTQSVRPVDLFRKNHAQGQSLARLDRLTAVQLETINADVQQAPYIATCRTIEQHHLAKHFLA